MYAALTDLTKVIAEALIVQFIHPYYMQSTCHTQYLSSKYCVGFGCWCLACGYTYCCSEKWDSPIAWCTFTCHTSRHDVVVKMHSIALIYTGHTVFFKHQSLLKQNYFCGQEAWPVGGRDEEEWSVCGWLKESKWLEVMSGLATPFFTQVGCRDVRCDERSQFLDWPQIVRAKLRVGLPWSHIHKELPLSILWGMNIGVCWRWGTFCSDLSTE